MRNNGSHEFSLETPFDPSYVTIVRLVAAAVANHLRFSLDEIEDLKVAVGESLNFFLTSFEEPKPRSLHLKIQSSPEGLDLQVQADGPHLGGLWEDQKKTASSQQVSSLLILENLVDRVSFQETKAGSEIRLTKKVRNGQRAEPKS